MTHHTEAELLRDIEEHMRKMWNERLLPASCWPTELAQRLTQAVRRAPAAPVPEGYKITEEQHVAACKVLLRAHGLDGTPQRMLNAILAAAPQPPEAESLKREDPVSNATLDGCSVSNAETEAAPAQLPEPDSYLFQHEETGLTQYVDAQQVEWGFEKNNPRWKRVGEAYSAEQVRQLLAQKG